MNIITTEIVDNGEKKDARGHKLITAKERTALIAAYEQSGLTQKAFAMREGVRFSTFTAWLRRYRKQAGGRDHPAFTELRLATVRPAWAMEIALPNGIVIRANQAQSVTTLVSALRSC
jgi:transposase-like protein